MANITQINGNLITAQSASYVPGVTTLSAAQVVRTGSYTLTNTFTNLTFNATILESNTAAVSHSTVFRDRVYVLQDGLYEVAYHASVGYVAAGATNYAFQVLKNNTTLVSGSLIAGQNSSTDLTTVSAQSLVQLTAGDYVALQARFPSVTGGIVDSGSAMYVMKMDGITGPSGSGGGLSGGTANFIPLWTSATAQGSSIMSYDLAKNEIIVSGNLHVNGTVFVGNEVKGIQGQVLGVARVNNLFAGF